MIVSTSQPHDYFPYLRFLPSFCFFACLRLFLYKTHLFDNTIWCLQQFDASTGYSCLTLTKSVLQYVHCIFISRNTWNIRSWHHLVIYCRNHFLGSNFIFLEEEMHVAGTKILGTQSIWTMDLFYRGHWDVHCRPQNAGCTIGCPKKLKVWILASHLPHLILMVRWVTRTIFSIIDP